MIVVVSLIVLLRELLVSTIFRMVHPYITIHSDLHLFHSFLLRAASYAHAHINATPRVHVIRESKMASK